MSHTVPHHKVDARLHARAKEKAAHLGVSLSAVAAAGLTSYTATANQPVTGAGTLQDKTRTPASLPAAENAALERVAADGNPESLASYVLALHNAGWSYRALAAPLHLTRQGLHSRVTAFVLGGGVAFAGAVMQAGPARNGAPAAGQLARFDWAIWVDRNVYVTASNLASRTGLAMQTLMENILTDFLAAPGTVSATRGADEGSNRTGEVPESA